MAGLGAPKGTCGTSARAVEDEAWWRMKRVKMEIHMEKTPVALGCCGPHIWEVAEEHKVLVDHNKPVDYLGMQVVVQKDFGHLGSHRDLKTVVQDKDQQPLQGEGSHCRLDHRKSQQDKDPQAHCY